MTEQNLSFEQSLSRLDEIVRHLEKAICRGTIPSVFLKKAQG